MEQKGAKQRHDIRHNGTRHQDQPKKNILTIIVVILSEAWTINV